MFHVPPTCRALEDSSPHSSAPCKLQPTLCKLPSPFCSEEPGHTCEAPAHGWPTLEQVAPGTADAQKPAERAEKYPFPIASLCLHEHLSSTYCALFLCWATETDRVLALESTRGARHQMTTRKRGSSHARLSISLQPLPCPGPGPRGRARLPHGSTDLSLDRSEDVPWGAGARPFQPEGQPS